VIILSRIIISQRPRINALDSIFVAALTVFFDYLFHLFETSPMEVPLYFIAKFTVAFLVAYLLINRIGPLLSAAVFTIFFDISYLSSSPTQVIQIDGITDPLTLVIVWTVAHGLFFLMAALIVRARKS